MGRSARRRGVTSSAARWSASIALVAGCVEPRTSVLLRVESELSWGEGARVQSVVVEVRRDGATGPLRSQRVTALGAGAGRSSLPLLIEARESTGDVSAPLWVEALGCATPNGCDRDGAVVAQRAVVRFVERETLRVTLLLASACAGVRCDTSERCETTTGACVPATSGASVDVGRDAAVMDHVVTEAGDVAVSVDRGGVDAASDVTDAMDAGERDVAVDVVPSPCPAGMVLIPAGEFDMGSTMAKNEQPVHRVRLSAFCIDRTEVTVAAYRACPTTACTEPRSIGACNWGRSDREDHPINCVDRSQAQGFCRWRGSDLPTEAQWEYAARGTGGRLYAWGEDAPSSRACWSGVAMRQGTCPAGAVEGDVSPFGVRDLGGNLTEWVRDLYGPYGADTFTDPRGPATGADFVTRGGAWDDDVEARLRAARRDGNNPILQAYVFGFRCAAAPR